VTASTRRRAEQRANAGPDGLATLRNRGDGAARPTGQPALD
jgi:hypothetical protein